MIVVAWAPTLLMAPASSVAVAMMWSHIAGLARARQINLAQPDLVGVVTVVGEHEGAGPQ